MSHANSDIYSKEHELKEIDEDVAQLEAALISDESTKEDRVLILADLKEHSERAGQLNTEIKDLYDYRARAEVELQHYQVVVADLGY